MKRLLMIAFGLAVTLSGMAAPHGFAGGVRPVMGHSIIVSRPGLYGGYGFGYSPYWGYNALYNPYYNRPSQLDLNISQINNDYAQQIADVRHDNALSRSERKEKIRDLRHEKESSIIDAKRNFYHPHQPAEKDDDVIAP